MTNYVNAVILDSDMSIISGDYKVDGDNFDEVVKAANKFAKNGVKCCIHWSRSSDNAQGFWGGRGASMSPIWFN